jgi:hypothetical protein
MTFNWRTTTSRRGTYPRTPSPNQASRVLTHKHSFDRTEFDGDYTPVNVSHLAPIPSGSRVLFRGTLLINSLSHLSEKGLQYLNHDFRMRIKRSAMNGVLSAGTVRFSGRGVHL